MDIESEIWTYAGTGTKVHAFVDGVALCRKNLRNDPARVKRMGFSYSGAVHYASVCRNCQFKFNAELEREGAYQARLAASMAPSTGEGDHLPPTAEVQDEVVIVAEEQETSAPDLVEALAILRKHAGFYDVQLRNAVDVLDNAGIFSAIDESTGYDVDPQPTLIRKSKCTCPSGVSIPGIHLAGCPGDPAEWGDGAYAYTTKQVDAMFEGSN